MKKDTGKLHMAEYKVIFGENDIHSKGNFNFTWMAFTIPLNLLWNFRQVVLLLLFTGILVERDSVMNIYMNNLWSRKWLIQALPYLWNVQPSN